MDNEQHTDPLTKKELMHSKRVKAKEKHSQQQSKVNTKQQIRKQRNRCAAQKSRDKKKQHLESVQKANQSMRFIIDSCERCRTELARYEEDNQQQERLFEEQQQFLEPQEQELRPITHTTPPTFLSDQLIRYDQESSDNLSKFLWFCCIVALLCFVNIQKQEPARGLWTKPAIPTNFHVEDEFQSNDDTLQASKVESGVSQSTSTGYDNPQPPPQTKKRSKLVSSNGLIPKPELKERDCMKCLDCFNNMTESSNGLQLLGSNSTDNETQGNTTGNMSSVIFCRGKTIFFRKIYAALRGEKKGKDVARMLIKGRNLLEFLQQNCFSDTVIDPEEDYLISFTMAILEVLPFKEKAPRKLTVQQ